MWQGNKDTTTTKSPSSLPTLTKTTERPIPIFHRGMTAPFSCRNIRSEPQKVFKLSNLGLSSSLFTVAGYWTFWSTNICHQVGKAQQRLYFIRNLYPTPGNPFRQTVPIQSSSNLTLMDPNVWGLYVEIWLLLYFYFLYRALHSLTLVWVYSDVHSWEDWQLAWRLSTNK